MVLGLARGSPTGEAWSLTFGDMGENGPGMQQYGTAHAQGLSEARLDQITAVFEALGSVVERHRLGSLCRDRTDLPYAELVVVRGGAKALLPEASWSSLRSEITDRKTDKKAVFRGVLKNKNARHNYGLGPVSQTADLPAGKGTIYAFSDLPMVDQLRRKIQDASQLQDLVGEVNHYYNVKKTYIGYHGDSERRVVVCVRFGADFPLMFQWYHRYTPIGDVKRLVLREGDIYFMSDLAVGWNWKRSSVPTLRHAAGFCVPTKEAKLRQIQRKRARKDATPPLKRPDTKRARPTNPPQP